MPYDFSYYYPTSHMVTRYRQRMPKCVKSKETAKQIIAKKMPVQEFARRANYMLLFSIYGEPGHTPDTEVRYYFQWNIVINNKNKKIITMYEDERRKVPPAHMFGDRRLRGLIYDLFFRPKSRVRQELLA